EIPRARPHLGKPLGRRAGEGCLGAARSVRERGYACIQRSQGTAADACPLFVEHLWSISAIGAQAPPCDTRGEIPRWTWLLAALASPDGGGQSRAPSGVAVDRSQRPRKISPGRWMRPCQRITRLHRWVRSLRRNGHAKEYDAYQDLSCWSASAAQRVGGHARATCQRRGDR